MIEVIGKNGTAKIMSDDRDENAIKHLYNIMNSDLTAGSTVRIMADYHEGKGAVIGYTQKLDKKNPRVCPNVTGGDIGCRVSAFKLPGIKDVDYAEFDAFVRKNIPISTGNYDTNSKTKCKLVSSLSDDVVNELLNTEKLLKEDSVDNFYMKTSVIGQLMSLGSGNHYIELDRGEDGDLWLNVHSGSRNFGIAVASAYQRKAEEYCTRGINELRYLDNGSPYLQRYLTCVKACQTFSEINHLMIMTVLSEYLTKGKSFDSTEMISTLHNYVDLNDMIVRKGAISAKKGEYVLIPLNMRDGIAICIGKGNQDYNLSAPHGCGRIMSRAQAKKNIDLDKVKQEMKDANVFTTSLDYALDEAADAYKNVDSILGYIKDTVNVVELLKPVYNIKGK